MIKMTRQGWPLSDSLMRPEARSVLDFLGVLDSCRRDSVADDYLGRQIARPVQGQP